MRGIVSLEQGSHRHVVAHRAGLHASLVYHHAFSRATRWTRASAGCDTAAGLSHPPLGRVRGSRAMTHPLGDRNAPELLIKLSPIPLSTATFP